MVDEAVVIVGGGLSGLACAQRLCEAGVACRVLEAEDGVGGRARTDSVDGFLLDRGFQVLLTAYPEAKRVLDYAALDLRPFEPGALIRYQGRFHRLVDPWRRPQHALATLRAPVATLGDKLRVGRLRKRVVRGSLEQLYSQPETTTREALRSAGFSERFIGSFFRPFLGGVFLDPDLETSSRLLDFVFRMFSQGDAALPAQGMGEMAGQMASRLPEGVVHTATPVARIEDGGVVLSDGSRITTRSLVLAVDMPTAARMLGDSTRPQQRGVTCLYFAARQPPLSEAILVLNGEGQGPVNNLCVPSQVSAAYAPAGQSLVSATVLGVPDDEDGLQQAVRQQLTDWFGSAVADWRHLRTYRIPHALPAQAPPALSPVEKPARRSPGLYVCGDYLDTASIQGAMASGRRAAEAVLKDRS
jgi:phytoene dehydrogenase-like protein